MKLSILDITVTEISKTEQNRSFRNLTHHIRELFIYLQSQQKIKIDGSSKITLCFGKQGEEVRWNNMLGCSNIFIEDFDFLKYYKLSRKEQDILILSEINNSLKKLSINKENHKEIDQIVEKIIDLDFAIEIPIKKLSKSTKDRKLKVSVYRILNSENGEIWKCNVLNKKTGFTNNIPLTKIPDFIDRTKFYKRASIENDIYRIEIDNPKKTVFELNLKEYCG